MSILIPETSTSCSWFPVTTAFAGYLAGFITEWFRDQRASKREREAREATRRDKLSERRADFERQTLLDLQESALQLARTTGEMLVEDVMAYRTTGEWQKRLYENELMERNRLAYARTSMLGVRVRDDTVRHLLQEFKDHCTAASPSASQEDSELSVKNMGKVFADLNQHIGNILRRLDDDEDAAGPG